MYKKYHVLIFSSIWINKYLQIEGLVISIDARRLSIDEFNDENSDVYKSIIGSLPKRTKYLIIGMYKSTANKTQNFIKILKKKLETFDRTKLQIEVISILSKILFFKLNIKAKKRFNNYYYKI